VPAFGDGTESGPGEPDRVRAELATRVRLLTEERDRLARQLEIVYSSKSWALTAPLRAVAAFTRSHFRDRTASATLLDEPTSQLVPGSTRPQPKRPFAPLPPPELRTRVAGTDDADWFNSSGRMAVDDICAALAAVDRSLGDFSRVYDFGCGCGRLTLPLTDLIPSACLTATDTDGEAVAWLKGRLPDARIETNEQLPPISFPDNSFDLIIGWSVLTHLPEHYQDSWLAELSRVLSPTGVMLLTVHGPSFFDIVGSPQDDPVRTALPERGLIVLENYGPNSPFAPYYQTTFHHPDYIRSHWAKWLDVLAIIPGAARPTHDMVVTSAGRSPRRVDPSSAQR
jgi:SAM-dependent methyltransferase